jgi:hypothetical protein
MDKRPPFPYQLLRELSLKKGIAELGYEELLWTEEWLTLRTQIKDRDNQTCQNCLRSQFRTMDDAEFAEVLASSGYGRYFNLLEGIYEDTPGKFSLKRNDKYPSQLKYDNAVKLQVHHKYYIWNTLPWEYDMSALTTLCDHCHELEHMKEPLVYTNSTMKVFKVLNSCTRCGGRGYIQEYKHIQNGICFACGGLGGLLDGKRLNLFDITK